MKDDEIPDNGINQSNLVIGIKSLMAQSDPIKWRPLYHDHRELTFPLNWSIA